MKDESKDEIFFTSFYGYPGSWKESQTPNFVARREGLVMWESYVNCGRTDGVPLLKGPNALKIPV